MNGEGSFGIPEHDGFITFHTELLTGQNLTKDRIRHSIYHRRAKKTMFPTGQPKKHHGNKENLARERNQWYHNPKHDNTAM